MSHKKIKGRFLHITWELFDSEVFQGLSNGATKALLLLLRQRQYQGQDTVKCPYSKAVKYLHRSTFAKAIRELESAEIIQVNRGGMSGKGNSSYTFISDWKRKRDQ